jgi:Secretion system C-terminal sorting domain
MNIYFSKINTSTNTSIEAAQLEGEDFQWRMYPNPTNDYLTIECNKEVEGKTILLQDANGKVVHTQIIQGKSIKLKMQHLPKGIYFLRLNNEVKKVIRK